MKENTVKERFTKGPWTACLNVPTAALPGHIIKTDYGVNRPIALVTEGGGTKGKPEQVANTYLMAAAPELYAVVEDLLDVISWLGGDGYEVDANRPNVRKAEKALAKARGEEANQQHIEAREREH